VVQEPDRVVFALFPKLPVDLREELLDLVLPGKIEVAGQPLQGQQLLGKLGNNSIDMQRLHNFTYP